MNIRMITWKEFKKEAQELKTSYQVEQKNNDGRNPPSPWLYRGQANANWRIETTLERFFINVYGQYPENYKDIYYKKLLSELINSINTIYDKEPFDHFTPEKTYNPNSNDYKTYLQLLLTLRHDGFPSPITDWTTCYKIAAYFACCNQDIRENIAIYAYNTKPQLSATYEGEAVIKRIAPQVPHSQKYEIQKAEALICTQFIGRESIIANLENTIEQKQNQKHILKKYIIDQSEKPNILEELKNEGITTETLFPPKESETNSLT